MEMTIARALAELKLLNSRIQRKIEDTDFVVANKKSSKKVKNTITKEEFINNSKADYQSILALIDRRNFIKSAIVESNSKTKIKINDLHMTVAEAIERKSSIFFDKNLLAAMESQYKSATGQVNINNEMVQEKLDNLLTTQFGKESNKKIDESDITSISVPYLAQNEWELIDGLDISKKIKALKDEIESFESEIDFALSEANCITKIEVPD